MSDGIQTITVASGDDTAQVWVRDADDELTPADRTVVVVLGASSATDAWRQLAIDLPSDVRILATASPEIAITALGLENAHLVCDEAGAATAAAYADAHACGTVSVIDSDVVADPVALRRAVLSRTGYLGPSLDPAPPTETFVLRSAD